MRIAAFLPALLLSLLPLLDGGAPFWCQAVAHLLLALSVAVLCGERLRRPADRGSLSAAPPLAVYGAWSLLFLAYPVYPHSVDRGVLNDLAALAFFFLASEGSESGRGLLRAGIAVGAAAAAAAALPEAWAWARGAGEAPSGTLVNANVLSAYLVLSAPVASLWWWERKKWAGVLFSAAAAAAVVASGSRAAWGAAALEAVILLPGRRPRLRLAGVLLLGCGAAAMAIDGDRLGWWRTALRMCAGTAFRGVGPGAFGEAYPNFRAVFLGQNTLFAHNFFLEVLAERGAAGAAALSVFLALLAVRVSRRFSSASAAFRAAAAGAAGFLAHGAFHVGFSFPAPAWTFWSLAGVLWAEASPFSPARSHRFFPRAGAAAGIGLALGAAVFSFTLFQGDECLSRAKDALSRGDVPSARAAAASGIRWNAREPELYSLRAAAAAFAGDGASAYADARAAARLAPASARFRAEAGEAALRRGLKDEAAGDYREAVRLLPLNQGYRARLEELSRGTD